jgi:hypothetical protein
MCFLMCAVHSFNAVTDYQSQAQSRRLSCRFYTSKPRRINRLARQPGMNSAQVLVMQRTFFKKPMSHIKSISMLFSLAAIQLTSINAHAALAGYDQLWPRQFEEYFQMVDSKVASLPPQLANQCSKHYTAIADKGTLDFRYALGYFDESHGISDPEYGYSPSLDGSNFSALREFLTKPCPAGSKRMSCGFSESGSPQSGVVQLAKSIRLLGKPVKVTMTLTHPSASEIYDDNVGPLASRQQMLTLQSEQNFYSGLSSADIVFYNGHSRDGGGPDFKPPVLNAKHKANYAGYYHIKREGFKNMMLSLKQNHAPAMVGLFSCFSKTHFHAQLLKNNPQQALILSTDAIDYASTTQVSLGYLEAILQGECGLRFSKIAKQRPRVQQGFFDYNFK